MKKILYGIFALSLVIMSCDLSDLFRLDKGSTSQIEDTNIYITSFSFEQKENQQLPKAYVATITDTLITIQIPSYYLEEYGDTLIPTIKGRYTTIYPQNNVQRNFNLEREGMEYSISNSDGYIRVYQVEVQPILNTEAKMVSVVLEANKNEVLTNDVVGHIAHDSKRVLLPSNNETSQHNKNYFVTIEVSSGATITPDPSTIQDFSSPIRYTITSEDSKTVNVYTVELVATLTSIIDINSVLLTEYKRTVFDNSVNVRSLQYEAESNEDNTEYTFYIPPAEYLFFKDKYSLVSFDFGLPATVNNEDFTQFPHTYKVVARDGRTFRNVEVDIVALPTPIGVVFYDKEEEEAEKKVYFSYDLTQDTIYFPTQTRLGNTIGIKSISRPYVFIWRTNNARQASAMEVIYLNNVDIEYSKQYFTSVEENIEGLYKKIRFSNGTGVIPISEDVGIISSKTEEKTHELHIDSRSGYSHGTYITEDVYDELIKDTMISSLGVDWNVTIGVDWNVTTGTEFSDIIETRITAVVSDYTDIAIIQNFDVNKYKRYVNGRYARKIDLQGRCSKWSNGLGISETWNSVKVIYDAHLNNTVRNNLVLYGRNFDNSYYTTLPPVYDNMLVDIGIIYPPSWSPGTEIGKYNFHEALCTKDPEYPYFVKMNTVRKGPYYRYSTMEQNWINYRDFLGMRYFTYQLQVSR